ncbi:hypothetical protein RHSP_06747 [Rhizobium freirei PRF 81]|uniref:Uncharacterized protein n=1 Tax=Rhizobium freirei PRF 81 TaxID=363754 RepID=N6V3E2_9HYPH|nr:DUF6117 family protein [Rhizobium freirei]ENN85562.1 hypothetical protein RHSP_06747 [Rhizobium freirei PRF 81]
MAIPGYVQTNFQTLLRAATDGNLALMECLDSRTQEPRYVLCAVGHDGTDRVFTPFGHLIGGNPYEAYFPPDPDDPRGFLTAAQAVSVSCRRWRGRRCRSDVSPEVWQSLLGGSSVVALAGDMTLRRVRVMNDYRIELVGFTDGMRDRLRSFGLFSEMIAWKGRFLIPASDDGQAVLSRLIERHRIVDVAGRG